jgi:hypothetical protein
MSKNVFANGREISAKKDDNQALCSMPDVCLSPPSPPAGPLPIPYPNTAKASDTSNGSKTVKIGGAEVGLKNSSDYKKSTGDEAATKNLGMGVVSHNIQGKLKHAAWSMDVLIEGANVIRHMDMVTQNHMNNSNDCPGFNLATEELPEGDEECVELEKNVREDVANDTRTGNLKENTTMSRANLRGRVEEGKDGELVELVELVKAATPMSNIKGTRRGPTQRGYRKPKKMVGETRDKQGYYTSRGQEPTIACSKSTRYRSKGRGGGGSTHTEAKFIEYAYARGHNSIVMRINWNDNGHLRHDPCFMCKHAICAAGKECEMEILYCTENEDGQLEKRAVDCPE